MQHDQQRVITGKLRHSGHRQSKRKAESTQAVIGRRRETSSMRAALKFKFEFDTITISLAACGQAKFGFTFVHPGPWRPGPPPHSETSAGQAPWRSSVRAPSLARLA